MGKRWPSRYARNLAYREVLRARGVCIGCRKPNATPEHWRCLACRVIESEKQIARSRRNRTTQTPA
jgi:hypothetical protein